MKDFKNIALISLVILAFHIYSYRVGYCRDTPNVTNVIISIDVESGHGLALPDQVNAISKNKNECGLQKMVGILVDRGYSATFFVNAYEYKQYGEDSLQKMTMWLVKNDQDVQLHTHPAWAYDENRPYMFQYTLAEQIEIIREGRELLEKWTGHKIIAHRAGAYSADKNTLDALIKNNILFDSSYFFSHQNSKIVSMPFKKNRVSQYGLLFEFPVTIYYRNEYSETFGENWPISVVRKYDINWFKDVQEAKKAILTAFDNKIDILILFLHSYSFIDHSHNAEALKTDAKAIDIFMASLDVLDKKRAKVVSFKDISEGAIDIMNGLNKADIIPRVSLPIGAAPYIIKKVHREKTYQLITIVGLLVIIVIGVYLVYINTYRKRKSELIN